MPHTVESVITLSERDYARGAMDLVPEEAEPLINSTVLETAVSIVKEAGPKVIEAIASRLVPVFRPQLPETFTPSLAGSGGNLSVPGVPEVLVSPPVETIVIVSPTNQSLYPPIITNPDTVGFIYWFNIYYHIIMY
jgi:hypothetical protein